MAHQLWETRVVKKTEEKKCGAGAEDVKTNEFSKSRNAFSKTVEFCQRFDRGLHVFVDAAAVDTRHGLASNERRKQRRKENCAIKHLPKYILTTARSSTTPLVLAGGVGRRGGFQVASTRKHCRHLRRKEHSQLENFLTGLSGQNPPVITIKLRKKNLR